MLRLKIPAFIRDIIRLLGAYSLKIHNEWLLFSDLFLVFLKLYSCVHTCMLVCTLEHIFTWITTRHSLVWHQLHVHMYVTDRVEEVGSVVCLCMRCVRRRKCSLMDSCTSVGMSGEVWLIFTAASRKPIEPTGSFTFSVAMVTAGCWGLGSRGGRRGGGGGCRGRRSGPQAGPRDGLWKWALARQGSQHSFQEASVRRPSRARPQTTNTPSRRPEEASGDEPRGPETEDHTIWTNRW